MGKIVQLSKHVINQIAAGEVIERPFSVVKELVENSVDAGATKISIEVANDCRDLRIADNGCGIYPDDIALAFSKHATSKIKDSNDLYNIKTMGFRGEALSSIISISKLTCITRTKEADYGMKVECKDSEITQTQTGCAVGTVMQIQDLFYNIPARLKFLKSAKTEFTYISEFIQAIALVNPQVAFELKFNGKSVLKTTAQNDMLQTVKELFSQDVAKNLKPVLFEDKLSGYKISGFASSPDYTRASKKDYYMYVNSRLVKCPVFQKAIDIVYKSLIGNTRYPFIILNLQIPNSDVDVNVHPAKREVRYKNPNQIFNFIYTSINSALKAMPRESEAVSEAKQTEQHTFVKEENINVEQNENISEIFQIKPQETVIAPQKQEFTTPKFVQPNIIQNKFIATEEYKSEDVIIGQYKKTYILIEKENGLEIVDQHIAEERYIYENLRKTKNIDCQLLFLSDVIEVSASDKEILEQNQDKLAKFGYEIEFLKDTELIFRKIPQLLSKISPKEILSDILDNISGDIDNIEEQILITTSCKAAVKANTYLNQYQMEEIIKNWRTCENPETCPHGRPISKFIEHKDIAKFFQRNK